MARRNYLPILAIVALTGCAPAFLANPGVDAVLYAEPPADAITFWGHATSYIDVNGVGIVTDPVFEDSYSLFHARKIPAPPQEAYDQTRIVLISHAHFDHLHPKTLARFAPGTVVLCPEPSSNHIDDLDLTVQVMAPGEEYSFSGGTIIAVAAHHPGGRLSLKARHDGGALGYVIETPEQTIYYSGDTEYFEGLHEIGREHRPDVVILNINGHLNSYDAMFTIAALGYPTVIPTHFGAYSGSNARKSPGWRSELEGLMGDVWMPLRVGESYSLTKEWVGARPAGSIAPSVAGALR